MDSDISKKLDSHSGPRFIPMTLTGIVSEFYQGLTQPKKYTTISGNPNCDLAKDTTYIDILITVENTVRRKFLGKTRNINRQQELEKKEA